MNQQAIEALKKQVADILGAAPDAPDPEAEAARLVAASLADGELDPGRVLAMAQARARGLLLPRLTGKARFMGLELEAGADVFVIREETELLGWSAVERLRASAGGSAPCLVDVGCGAGNLTCGIAAAVPAARIWAIDIDPACVGQTRRNVLRHGLQDRVEVLEGDLFAPLEGLGLEGALDLVVCNPPYIASVRLEKDRAYLLDHEPRAAFDGGPYGISMQMRLVKESLRFLRPGGWLAFEFGAGQERQVQSLAERSGGYDRMEIARDAGGAGRVSLNRKADPA